VELGHESDTGFVMVVNSVMPDVKLPTLLLLRHAMQAPSGSNGKTGHNVQKAVILDHVNDSAFVMVESLATKDVKPTPLQVRRNAHVLRKVLLI